MEKCKCKEIEKRVGVDANVDAKTGLSMISSRERSALVNELQYGDGHAIYMEIQLVWSDKVRIDTSVFSRLTACLYLSFRLTWPTVITLTFLSVPAPLF